MNHCLYCIFCSNAVLLLCYTSTSHWLVSSTLLTYRSY